MRPDWIVVGEVRGAEAFELTKGCQSGNGGVVKSQLKCHYFSFLVTKCHFVPLEMSLIVLLRVTSTRPNDVDIGPGANGVEQAMQSKSIDGVESRRSKPFNTAGPGASTFAARSRVRRLQRDLRGAVEKFELARERHWRTPRPEGPPKLPCRIRGCPAEGLEVPAEPRRENH